MAIDPPTSEAALGIAQRRQSAIVAGHSGDVGGARRAFADLDPSVQAAALGALDRLGELTVRDLLVAFENPSAQVRRRAADLAASARGPGSRSTLIDALRSHLLDHDPLVAEASAWALGERRTRAAVGDLATMARSHSDARCREAALSALGSIGDPSSLDAVLGGLNDRPGVRRRAVVALAAFEGPVVDEAIAGALDDRDWQVRQSAEILLDEPPGD